MFHTLSSSPPPHFASPFSLIPTLLPNYPLYFSLSRHLLWNDQFVAQFRLSSMGAVCCRPQVCPAVLVLQPPVDPFVPRSSTSMLTLTSFTSFSSDASARVLLARYSYLPQSKLGCQSNHSLRSELSNTSKLAIYTPSSISTKLNVSE